MPLADDTIGACERLKAYLDWDRLLGTLFCTKAFPQQFMQPHILRVN
jgi:hypothetical protein